MSLGERLREGAYWTLDFLKGKPVRNHYDEVWDGYYHGADEEVIREKMQRILRHAVETTDFYAYLKEKDELKLSDFPVMNKMKYLDNYQAVESKQYKNAKGNLVLSTSGSTGTPFSVIQNKDKVDRNNAVSLVWNRVGGYRLGDKRAMIRVWSNTLNKSELQKLMENLITIDSSVLNDEKLLEVCQIMEKKHVKSLTGYASHLTELAKFIDRQKVDTSKIHLNSIFSISERLDVQYREMLKKQFRCPVNSFYSSMENGNMTMQDGGDEYHLDSTTWFIEILKFDSDEPAAEGELGRVAVTDLYNYAFPLIRYDNGDAARMKKVVDEKTGKVHVILTEVFGRRLDMVYDIHGAPISPHLISVKMKAFQNIQQWKFVQKAEDEYAFVLNNTGEVDLEGIKKEFAELIGDKVEFEFVKEIPVLSSGKRKPIENLMNKK